MAVEIQKDTIIGDILDIAPETAPIYGNRYALSGLPGFQRRNRGRSLHGAWRRSG